MRVPFLWYILSRHAEIDHALSVDPNPASPLVDCTLLSKSVTADANFLFFIHHNLLKKLSSRTRYLPFCVQASSVVWHQSIHATKMGD